MNDAVTTTKQIWEKLMEGDIKAFTISDIIFAVGLIVLTVLAIKIGYKMAKVLLVILLLGLIVFYLITKGIIPIG